MGCVTYLQERELQRLQLEMWAFNHHFWKQHNTEFQEVHACVLFSRKCDTTDMIVLLYHQRKEEFIRQTLEEKRARGEIAGEVYASP